MKTNTGNGTSRRAPPLTEAELLERAGAVAGRTLAELAATLGIHCPVDMQHDKGWAGQLLEMWLGASATSQPKPDFPELGIELKTLPVDDQGRPRESTYVCTVNLQPACSDWYSSVVWQKLKKVLWLPLVSGGASTPGQRRIGAALLWSPTTGQATILRQDWEELMDLVGNGQLEQISSRQGRYLQIRPKAANARALTPVSDAEGNPAMTLPRGFYLRPVLTRQILTEHYHI